jgi:hypothetical protein
MLEVSLASCGMGLFSSVTSSLTSRLQSNAVGVVGGVREAGDAIASVIDEMVGDHGDLEDVLETTLAQLGPEHGPELGAVIGLEAGAPDQSGEN